MVELDLVGVPDIAEMIGSVRQYAHRLSRGDPEFPEPAVELNRGVRLWKRADIEKWMRATGREVEK
jgi:predicted DNA-binding transcriptional regulator AlpA